jgi:peptidoglycan/xylan/chitin deacetylase (PgdA/CDA1 family)
MADEGHQVGNHTQTHRELPLISDEARHWELGTAGDVLAKILGHEPTTIRPPFGSYNAAVREHFNGPNVLWSIDPQDWRNHSADYITQHILTRAQDGDIILLHDVYQHTYRAVRRIVPALLARGFVFVTVDEMLEFRGAAGEDETVRHRRP